MSKIVNTIRKAATRITTDKEDDAIEILTKSNWPNFIITDTHLVFQMPLSGTSENLIQSIYAAFLEIRKQNRAKKRERRLSTRKKIKK